MNNVLRFSEFLNEAAMRKNVTTIQDFVKELQSFDSKIKLEGHNLEGIDFSKNWNKDEDTVSLDFGA